MEWSGGPGGRGGIVVEVVEVVVVVVLVMGKILGMQKYKGHGIPVTISNVQLAS